MTFLGSDFLCYAIDGIKLGSCGDGAAVEMQVLGSGMQVVIHHEPVYLSFIDVLQGSLSACRESRVLTIKLRILYVFCFVFPAVFLCQSMVGYIEIRI
jgi:hypothetical protein